LFSLYIRTLQAFFDEKRNYGCQNKASC